MDWALAIQRNRHALLAIVAAIVALLGGREGSGPVARRLRSATLALLRPAEAATRRLIVVAARGLVAAPAGKRSVAFDRASFAPSTGSGLGSKAVGTRPPAFPLFDRRKRFGRLLRPAEPRGIPRIRTFWGASQAVIAAPAPALRARPDPDAPVEIGRLRLRIGSLEAALADLPRQAKRLAHRLARLRARRASGVRSGTPLRSGRPPGHRLRPSREVDFLLRECHALAKDALAQDAVRRDTS